MRFKGKEEISKKVAQCVADGLDQKTADILLANADIDPEQAVLVIQRQVALPLRLSVTSRSGNAAVEYKASSDCLERLFADDKQIIFNQTAPNSIEIGDYVFASRWGDCDPHDPWVVGFVTELDTDSVVVGSHSPRAYPKAMKITKEQGDRIVKAYQQVPVSTLLSYADIAYIFNGE